jgi:mRNA-degrading endonuclease toxin of MazEF toxin-antitoxin module
MTVPRRGDLWTTKTPATQPVLVLSSSVYNAIGSEPTVIVALVTEQATEEGFCVALGRGQWAVMGLVTFIPKTSLASCERRVDTQTLTDANNMLFKILATPE